MSNPESMMLESEGKPLTKVNLNDLKKKLSEAERYKEAGNVFCKNGDFKKAAGQYHRGILFLKGIDNDLFGTPDFLKIISVHPYSEETKIPEDIEQKCLAVNISVYNNLSASLLKVEGSDPLRILHYTNIVLELDPINSKALYRRAQAHYIMKDYDDAAETLKCIPKPDRDVLLLLKKAETSLKEEAKSQKAMYKNMFK
uniref:Rotamase n=1 Tax=Lepeophtheirus salmonis TaxID=72036 RepID=D3PGQ9_LEPSM|nr:Tetratricopeptide repeat protein 9C [Lepeophtheirus salmonis]